MNEIVSLRTANEADVGAIQDLTRKAYAKWVELTGREPLPMRADYADAIKKHRFDLLFCGSRLAALIETVPADNFLLIENVAVLPAFQGRGLGTRLLTFAEDRASSLGMAGTRLYTNSLFVANLRLYAALGYQVEREQALAGGIAVHMIKTNAKR